MDLKKKTTDLTFMASSNQDGSTYSMAKSFLRPISTSSLMAAYIGPSLKSKKKTDDSPGRSSGKGKLIGSM